MVASRRRRENNFLFWSQSFLLYLSTGNSHNILNLKVDRILPTTVTVEQWQSYVIFRATVASATLSLLPHKASGWPYKVLVPHLPLFFFSHEPEQSCKGYLSLFCWALVVLVPLPTLYSGMHLLCYFRSFAFPQE